MFYNILLIIFIWQQPHAHCIISRKVVYPDGEGDDLVNKRKTCAPRIYSKMISEKYYAKYEKYLHEINVNELMIDD